MIHAGKTTNSKALAFEVAGLGLHEIIPILLRHHPEHDRSELQKLD